MNAQNISRRALNVAVYIIGSRKEGNTMQEKELMEKYLREFDECVAMSKMCFEKYNETRDERWKEDGITWIEKAAQWREWARRDLVYLV